MYLFFERYHGGDAHRSTLARRKKMDLEKVTNEKRIICGYLRKTDVKSRLMRNDS